MKTPLTKILLLLILILVCLSSEGQLPIKFKTVEQGTAKPEDGELYFMTFYYSKPINVKFDGKTVSMIYDNGRAYLKKKVNTFDEIKKYDDNKLILTYILDVSTDTIKTRDDEIKIIIDNRFNVPNRQIIVPTNDKYGDNYTCFRRFAKGY